MRKLTVVLMAVFCVMIASIVVPAKAEAGSYTITTTAEQDIQLQAAADFYEFATIQDLINTRFLEQIATSMENIKITKSRKIRRALSSDVLSAEDKATIEAIADKY